MSLRQIVLDTETTGIEVEAGHRIIEIGCVEMIDRKLTGNNFHYYINPEREIDAGALAVHGINAHFLRDKPIFGTIANELIGYLAGAELIIHNAVFDVSFINNELMLTRQGFKTVADYCCVIDTLQIARRLHVGQRNSLDALCKRYGIDNSKRELHGALLDATLLAQVYLVMTGGQGSFFDSLTMQSSSIQNNQQESAIIPLAKHELVVLKASEEELLEHEAYLENMKKSGLCLWQEE